MGRHAKPVPARGRRVATGSASPSSPSPLSSSLSSPLPSPSPSSAAASRGPRIAAVALVWIVGLVVGFFGMLSVAARFGCSPSQTGLACGSGGTALGVVITVLVIAVVTTVTLVTFGRSPRWLALCTLAGLLALGLCYLAARGLLDTA